MRRGYKGMLLAGACVLLITAGGVPELQAKAKKTKIVSLTKAKITLDEKSYAYSGEEIKPVVKVVVGKKTLKKNKDYTVTYKKNIKVGKGSIIVQAKNKKLYKGKKTVSFTIGKAERKLLLAKTSYSAVAGDSDFEIPADTEDGGGNITYSCKDSSIVTVSKQGVVSVVGPGVATVVVATPETTNYKAASASVKVVIAQRPVRDVDSKKSITEYNYPVLNYACAGYNLKDLTWGVNEKYVIPGLATTAQDDLLKQYIHCGNLCPQGICVAGDYLLTTAYCMDDVHTSCVFVFNRATGAYLNTLILTEKSHVGGITYDGGDGKEGNVWICHSNSNRLQRIPYSVLKTYATGTQKCVEYKADELEMSDKDGFHSVANRPSAISYNPVDGYLWVTEYVMADVDKSATMAAYEYKNGQLCEVQKYLHTAEEDYLGIITDDAETEELQQINVSAAVVVASVTTEKGGFVTGTDENKKETVLEQGDFITQVDGKSVGSPKELNDILSEKKEGEQLAVSGKRITELGKVVDLSAVITLGQRSVKAAVRQIPYYVQGLTFTKDGRAVFSRSRGRNQTKKRFVSELMVFEATWNKEDLWDANEKWEESIAVSLPPMAEEVEMVGDELYILFESASMTYLEGTDGIGRSDSPIDKVITVKLPE